MPQEFRFTFQDDKTSRLDAWLTRQLDGQFSRSQIQGWIREGHLSSPAYKRLPPSLSPKKGDSFVLRVPEAKPSRLQGVDLQLNVIYEDEYLAVIHKPAGIATHPGPKDRQLSIANGILYLWNTLPDSDSADEELRLRPGIVHRLDKATEGLLLIGLEDKTRRSLMSLFQKRLVTKEYHAWVIGALPAREGRIELGIRRHPQERLKMQIDPKGRLAITKFERIESRLSRKGRRYEYVRLKIETGRTHQIRVHLAHLGAPIVGDMLYSRSYKRYEQKFGMLLYASYLGFEHPVTREFLEFRLDAPKRFEEFSRVCESY